jgi:hypothetical protein
MVKKRVARLKPTHPVKKSTTPLPGGDDALLQQLKERIRLAHLRASLAVSRELVLIYWQIGRDILTRQKQDCASTTCTKSRSLDLLRTRPDRQRNFAPFLLGEVLN